jgi:hypothetical protein
LINIALSLAAVIDAFARNMMIDEAPGTSKSRDEPKDPAIARRPPPRRHSADAITMLTGAC